MRYTFDKFLSKIYFHNFMEDLCLGFEVFYLFIFFILQSTDIILQILKL